MTDSGIDSSGQWPRTDSWTRPQPMDYSWTVDPSLTPVTCGLTQPSWTDWPGRTLNPSPAGPWRLTDPEATVIQFGPGLTVIVSWCRKPNYYSDCPLYWLCGLGWTVDWPSLIDCVVCGQWRRTRRIIVYLLLLYCYLFELTHWQLLCRRTKPRSSGRTDSRLTLKGTPHYWWPCGWLDIIVKTDWLRTDGYLVGRLVDPAQWPNGPYSWPSQLLGHCGYCYCW